MSAACLLKLHGCMYAAQVSVHAYWQVLGGLFKGVKYYRDGGSIPALALFEEHLGMHMTCFSFGLPDDSIHAPNER